MRRIAFLLIALFLALVVMGCGSPDQSVKMFLKYRIKGDIAAAKLYCTDTIDMRMDQGEFTVEALGFGNPYGTPISWEGEKGKINLVEVGSTDEDVTITNGTGPKKVTFHLTREGGMWKINNITPAPIAEMSPTDFGAVVDEAGEKVGEFTGEEEGSE